MASLFRLLILVLLTVSSAAVAEPAGTAWQEAPQLADLFRPTGINGTFIVRDPVNGQIYVYNSERAKTRYAPASTFKIPNSLIGFETGAIRDTSEVFPYNGQPQFRKEWEHDMTIGEAIAVSNVTVYQEIARRIGLPVMQGFLRRMGYGNQDTGTAVDEFWLKGPLQISAFEQLQIMENIAHRRGPFSPRSYDLLHGILPQETNGEAALFYKTGWTGSFQPSIGWLVGWVERNGQIYPFAFNMDMPDIADADKRLNLSRDALKRLGFY